MVLIEVVCDCVEGFEKGLLVVFCVFVWYGVLDLLVEGEYGGIVWYWGGIVVG